LVETAAVGQQRGDGVDLVLPRAPADRLAGTTTGRVIERVFSSFEAPIRTLSCMVRSWSFFKYRRFMS
jgi:hypothetical protein